MKSEGGGRKSFGERRGGQNRGPPASILRVGKVGDPPGSLLRAMGARTVSVKGGTEKSRIPLSELQLETFSTQHSKHMVLSRFVFIIWIQIFPHIRKHKWLYLGCDCSYSRSTPPSLTFVISLLRPFFAIVFVGDLWKYNLFATKRYSYWREYNKSSLR